MAWRSGTASRAQVRRLFAAWICFSVGPAAHYALIFKPLPHWPGWLELVPGTHRRAWMRDTPGGYANRYLPMLLANQAGWDVRSDGEFTATWNGGAEPDELHLACHHVLQRDAAARPWATH